MIRNLPIIALTFFCIQLNAQSFVVTYGFADVTGSTGNVDPSPCPAVAGLAFGSFSAIGTPINPNASGRFSFTDWPLGAIDAVDSYSAYTGALSGMTYYEMRLSVMQGYTLSLNALSFAVRRSGTGIRNYCVRSSLDNYSNNLSAGTGSSVKLSVIPTNVFFWNYDSVSTASDQKGSNISFGSAFSNLTGTLNLRFYAWNAEASGGSFSVDNVAFSGLVKDSLALYSGVEENKAGEETTIMSCFPNPSANGKVFVQVIGKFPKIVLMDARGGITRQKVVCDNEGGCELNVADLPPGMYFLKTDFPVESKTIKLIIEH